MININNFVPNLLSIDKISFKRIDAVAYPIKYITMKSLDHANIDSENSLYLVFNNVDGHVIEESNEDIYLIFASKDKNKQVLKSAQNFGTKLKIKLKQ